MKQIVMNKRLFFVWLSFFFIIQPIPSQVSIFLKNGDSISGEWIGGDNQKVYLEIDNQQVYFQVSTIESIMFKPSEVNSNARKYLKNGNLFNQRGLTQEAKSLYQKSLEESPNFSRPYFRLAEIAYKENNIDSALNYIKFACLIDNPEYDIAQLLNELGNQFVEANSLIQATTAYSLILKHFPDYPSHKNLSYSTAFLFAQDSSQAEKALELLQLAIDKYPNHSNFERASYLVGDLQCKSGKPNLAVLTLTDFILSYPDSPWLSEAYLARGSAFIALNQNQKAIYDFNYVIENPKNAQLRREARNRRDGSAWSVYKVSEGLPSNQVQAVAIDDGIAWVGTSKGLAYIDLSSQAEQNNIEVSEKINNMFDRGPINVRALEATDEGVWVGTMNHGLIYYDKETDTTTNYTVSDGLPHKLVYDIEMDELNNELWVGTFSGLARYRRSINTWVSYNREEHDLPADDIVALAVTPVTVWIGTSQSGLAYYSRTEDMWRRYGVLDGLDRIVGKSIISFDTTEDRIFFTWYNRQRQSNGYVEADLRGFNSIPETVISGTASSLDNIHIVASDNSLWIATNEDIYKRSRYSGEWDQIAYPVNRTGKIQINCIELNNDVAWVGTTNGLAQLSTLTLTDNQPDSISEQTENDEFNPEENEVNSVLPNLPNFLPQGVENQNE